MSEYFLKPGFIYHTSNQNSILTVLGSSVAITMYDRGARRGGMNHFFNPNFDESATPLRMMTKQGSALESIEAQIFGGASRDGDDEEMKMIGSNNVDAAMQLLDFYGIRVIGSDVGGKQGRKIIFNVYTGEVIIAKVNNIRREDWYPGIFHPPSDRLANS